MSLKDNTAVTEAVEGFPGRKRGKGGLLAAALLVVVAVGGWWYWQHGQQQQAADAPLLATVEIGSIENTVASAGTLKPSRFVDVGAQVSGQLQKLHVQVGDVVEEGQLLAEIDARVQMARLEASRASIAAQEAQLEARKAQLVLARANAARQERLMADVATSQLEFDNAVNNLASAESSLIQLERQIEQSKATLSSDETQLGFSRIFAPTSGTIVSIEMIEGRTLNAAQQAPNILRIADLSTMTVEADVSEADIGSIRTGMEVYFTTLGGGNRRWYGTLRQILPTPEVLNNVVLYTGLFDVDNSDGALLSEMTAQVYFITSSAEMVLTVPVGALSFTGPAAGGARVAGRPGNGQVPPNGAALPNGMVIPGGGGAMPAAGGPGVRVQGGGPRAAAGPRPATVTIVNPDGSEEVRDVLVGVTSRVAAEIISGLREGEQVVAGILQAAPAGEAPQQNQPNVRIGGGGFGGFR